MVVHMRHTRAHTANRRSHHFLTGARFETCAKCGTKHLMHRVCGNCGNYRGRVVIDVAAKAMKRAKKAEAMSGKGKAEEAKSEEKTTTKSKSK